MTPAVLEVVRRYWGFDALRPIQGEAIAAALQGRDSLVVLPTGGGKSLCYQVPAAVSGTTDVVVSPLIALMKDQVDGLRASGYPAVALHGGMSLDQLRAAESEMLARRARLVFVAPERLVSPRFLAFAERLGVRRFAVDEAHCISHWGHDFRPEYRQLALLRERFPSATLHAYTATATERVRDDIAAQLRLRDPTVLVGTFDRPNLLYRVVPRSDGKSQIAGVLRRHKGEAAIVYCISRDDTERVATHLIGRGVHAAHYHAGMDAAARHETQERFSNEEIDVVVATVAFGMGIDRGDVRCVLHAAMPKSIEHYQQETGRAGRDGLPAECVLLHSPADGQKWESLIRKSVEEAAAPEEVALAALELLSHMRRYALSVRCRHRALSEYFGQRLEAGECGACDVCLGEVDGVADGTVTAQKILSCVYRVGERFGVEHVADVLLGADTDRVRRYGHAGVSTYGLMKDLDRRAIVHLIYQVLDQGLAERSDGEYPVLRLNAASREVLRGQREVKLVEPRLRAPAKAKRAEAAPPEEKPGDRGLFEGLRKLRKEVAQGRGVAPFVVFSDATLWELARVRPSTLAELLAVKGVGQRKMADLGPRFVAHVVAYCKEHGLPLGVARGTRSVDGPAAKEIATALFERGAPVAEVAATVGRAPATVHGWLADYIAARRPERIDAWVDEATYARVAAAVAAVGAERMKPIFDHLAGAVGYEAIRLVSRHLAARSRSPRER